MKVAHVALFALSLAACGGTDEPAPYNTNENLSEPDIGYGEWCAATYEDIDDDTLAEGFDATPGEARDAVQGTFVGSADGVEMSQFITVHSVQLVRVERFQGTEAPTENELADGAVLVDGPCGDHYLLRSDLGLDAGPLLTIDTPIDVFYFDGEDAGDGYGWDRASLYLNLETWSGTAAPTWDPNEMERIAMRIEGRFGLDTWSVNASFWGESLPTGTGDGGTVWVGEEMLFEAELLAEEL